MKNIFILFLSFFNIIAYSQNQISAAKLPSQTPTQVQTINASNFKVELDKINNYIHWSFNFSGDYFRVQTTVYKNSISESNRIAYGIKEDEAWYEPIHYPDGSIYSDWNFNPNSSAFVNVTKYVLVIKAWEVTNSPELTLTLEYTPPAPPVNVTPNLSIAAIQVFNSSNVKIYDSSTNPGGSFSLKKNNTYTFITKVKKTGNVAVNNVRLDLFQYDRYWGDYPNTSPSTPQTQNLNFSAGETEKNVTFLTNIINFGAQANAMGVAFHVDKNNTIAETNENDNIGIVVAGYQNRIASPEIVDVSVYDANGNFIKTVETTSNDSDFINVKSKLGSGKYILKSKEQSRQVLIK